MKKRLLSMILALSMVLTILPVNAITAFAEYDYVDHTYQCGATAEDSVTATVQYSTVTSRILIISGSGKMKNYTENTVPWAEYADDITEVVVSDGVTSIGDYAAYNCRYLQTITIAGSVTSIGNYAFSKCYTFKKFPDLPNVTVLGEGVFSGCSGMTSCPTFSSAITKIPDKIFQGCTGIKNYTISSNITEIGKGAFQNCGIESVTIPDSVRTIEAEAFQGCKKLRSVTFTGNSKITKIENGVFANCSALTTISIPTSVTAIGSQAFQNCTSLTNVGIPDGVTSIGDEAFYGCSALESVTIPSKPSKVELGSSAFENSGLKEVTIPENVTFGLDDGYANSENTFMGCTKLKKAVVNAKVENLGSIFRDCTALDDVTLPNTLKSLSYTFKGCTALKKITLPEGLETIGNSAFYNSGLESIEIPATVKTIKGTDSSYTYMGPHPAFAESKLKSVTMKDGTIPLTIEDYTFYKCKDLRTVKLPKRLSKIGANSFSECKNSSVDCLTEVEYNGSDKDLTGVESVNGKALGKYMNYGWILGSGSNRITILHDCILNFYKDDSSENAFETIIVRRKQTVASVDKSIPIPTKEGYTFDGWYLKEKSTEKVEESILNGNIDESMDLVAHWTKAPEYATVTVGTLNNGEQLVKGNRYEFTVTIEPKDDTGNAKLTFGDVKGTIKDSNGTVVDANGVNVTLTTGNTQNLTFTFIPSEVGNNQTLTATLTKEDNSKVTGNTAYSVRKRNEATVEIIGLDNATVKAGEAKDFTVSVTPNDDTIEKVTFDTTSGVVQWSNDGGNTWTTVTGDVNYGDLTGKQFRVVPAADAANGTVTVTVTAKKADNTEVAKTASFTVTARVHATVAINDLNSETIKQNKAHTFTVTVTANDDSGNATLTFDDINGLTYNDAAVTDAGVTVALTKDQPATLTFTLTPSETGSKTLKATLNNGANDSATYTVSEYVHANVAIDGLDSDLKQGESKDFTVKVDPKDDSGKATIDFGSKNDEIQYKDSKGNWKPMPPDGLDIDLSNGEKTYDFRITPKDDGGQTLTATVKQGDTVLGETTKDFTVAKKDEPVNPNPGGGETGGGDKPGTGENPGGGETGGGDKPGTGENPGDGGNTNPGGDGGNTNPGGDGGNTNPGGDGGNTKPGDGGNTKPGDGDHTGDKDPETKSYELTVIGGSFTAKQGENALTVETTKADNSLTAKIPEGAVITVTLNKDAVPEGMVFDQWKINDDDLMGNPDVAYDQETFHFTMPEHDVKVEVMYRDATIESDGPGILGTGAMIATVGISAAALAYQGHMLGTEFALRCMLPEWALIPQNRAELAVLLWQDADSPEPVSTNLYSDISEDDSAVQKAARWAVENDLMELLDAEEAPENFDPFVPVTYLDSIHAWKKAQELKK